MSSSHFLFIKIYYASTIHRASAKRRVYLFIGPCIKSHEITKCHIGLMPRGSRSRTVGVNSSVTYRGKTKRTVIKCELFRVRFVPSQMQISRFPLDAKSRDTYNGALTSPVTKLRHIHIQIFMYMHAYVCIRYGNYTRHM